MQQITDYQDLLKTINLQKITLWVMARNQRIFTGSGSWLHNTAHDNDNNTMMPIF